MLQAHKERSTNPLQKGIADNFPKHLLRRHCLYVAGAALEEAVLKEGIFSLTRIAWWPGSTRNKYSRQAFPPLNFPLHNSLPQQNNRVQQALQGADSFPAFRASTMMGFHLAEAAVLWAWHTQAVPMSQAQAFSLRKRFLHCHLVVLWNDSRQVKSQANQKPELGLITLYLCWDTSSHSQNLKTPVWVNGSDPYLSHKQWLEAPGKTQKHLTPPVQTIHQTCTQTQLPFHTEIPQGPGQMT